MYSEQLNIYLSTSMRHMVPSTPAPFHERYILMYIIYIMLQPSPYAFGCAHMHLGTRCIWSVTYILRGSREGGGIYLPTANDPRREGSVAKLIYRMYFRIVEKQRGNCVRREVYHPGNYTLESRFYTIDVFTQSVPPEKFNAGISNTKYCLVDKLTRLFEFHAAFLRGKSYVFFFLIITIFLIIICWALFHFSDGDIPTSS